MTVAGPDGRGGSDSRGLESGSGSVPGPRPLVRDGHHLRGTRPAGVSLSGRASLLDKPWGTSLTLNLTGLPPTGRCILQTSGSGGIREQAATWSATASGSVTVVGATSLHPSDLTGLAVVDQDGQVLGTATPSPRA
ncbi:MAG: hypothetical protein ACYDC9_13285 [Dermatophilaceae bacterium]